MSGMVAWFARNSVAANLLMVVAFFGGIFSYFQMEREMFPSFATNGAAVTMVWQGASPQDVEEQIVTRIEEAVADINGLDRITSISREGFGNVIVIGREGIDMDAFVDEVERRVSQINNLPQAAFQPQVNRSEARNWFFGTAVHGDVDELTLKRVADAVRDDIALLPGGDLAVLEGTLSEEVSIEVSEVDLRRYNLTIAEVAQAIREASVNSSGGRMRSPVGEVAMTTRNQADTKEQFENIIIRQSTDQGMLRVRDVASVIDGFIDADLDARYDNRKTAFVFMPSPDVMNLPEYAKGFRDYIECANTRSEKACEDVPVRPTLPEGMKIDILWDDSVIFDARMKLITESAGLGALLVCIILILFLRPIVAFWVTVGIMTAFAGGIFLLPFLGVSWNILSTFAVLLVIGVIVDDAIVVGENIHKEVESGRREGLDAAIVGTQLVLKPIVFGVITTIVAFLPWLFLDGGVRNQTMQISLVVVAALTFSIIECMFILPAHLAHMKKQTFDGRGGGINRAQRRIADSLLWFAANVYKPTLELALKFRYATVMLFVSIFFLSLSAVSITKNVPTSFLPEIEGDLIQVTIDLPDGTPFSRTMQVREQLANAVDVATIELNDKWDELDEDVIDSASIVASNARIQAWIGLIAPENRPETLRTREISDTIREKMGLVQDAEEVSFNFTQNESSNGIQFTLNHPDLERLRDAADVVKTQLATYATATDIGDNLTAAADEIQISLKPGAEALGLTISDVSSQIRQAYFGFEVQRLPREGEDVRVMVRLPKVDRDNLDSLQNLRIRIPDAGGFREVPITQVVDFTFAPGINQIVRRDRTRSVRVFADIVGREGRGPIVEDMDENFWPDFEQRFPDISRGYAGDFLEQQRFMQQITTNVIIALLVMYILLAIAFGSYAQPLLLMTAIPFAFCGAVFGTWAFGSSFGVFSMFGIAAAAGVVINDNLVLVDYINRRRAEGIGAVQAIVDAGVSRFRPILLTSVTTFVGILPLIAEKSVQAQFLKPMVISLGCAVAFAIFMSLFLVPALYAIGVEIGRVFKWTWGGVPYRRIGEGYSGEVSIDEEELIGSSQEQPRPFPAE
ncbi:MAG: efflux RND transporter permease subunit [Pseudomonadota bacterium]